MMFYKSMLTVAIFTVSFLCHAQSKGVWKDNVMLKNLTNKKIKVRSAQLFPNGWKHDADLYPFKSSSNALDSIGTKPLSEVTVLWNGSEEKEKKSLIKIIIPPIIEKNPEKLAYFVFNFDQDNCFLSYKIYQDDDPEYLIPIREILPDGSDFPITNEAKKYLRCRKPDGSPEDAHYVFASFVTDRNKQPFGLDVEIDQKCRILYAKDEKEKEQIQSVVNNSLLHELFIRPSSKRMPLKLTKEWKILTDPTLSK